MARESDIPLTLAIVWATVLCVLFVVLAVCSFLVAHGPVDPWWETFFMGFGHVFAHLALSLGAVDIGFLILNYLERRRTVGAGEHARGLQSAYDNLFEAMAGPVGGGERLKGIMADYHKYGYRFVGDEAKTSVARAVVDDRTKIALEDLVKELDAQCSILGPACSRATQNFVTGIKDKIEDLTKAAEAEKGSKLLAVWEELQHAPNELSIRLIAK